MKTYVVTFTSDGLDTCEVDQPGVSAVDAVRAVHKGYAHIAVCGDVSCRCYNRRFINVDGFIVAEPVKRHAGPVYYQTVTPHGMVTVRVTGDGAGPNAFEV